MASVVSALGTGLRDQIGLRRAVETGADLRITARAMAGIFPEVVPIELSNELHASASSKLSGLPQVKALEGHSAEPLRGEVDPSTPTLYFLDGHWSGGAEDECPVIDEVEVIGAGHPDDCLIIDDSRLFTSSPPPSHDPTQRPSIVEVFDAVREQRSEHSVSLLDGQVVAVPARARPVLNAYSLDLQRVHPFRVHVSAGAQGLRPRLGR